MNSIKARKGKQKSTGKLLNEKAIDQPQTLSTEEAARYLGISKSSLDKARSSGLIGHRTPMPPYTRIGDNIRYPLDELNKWLQSLPRFSNTAEESAVSEESGDE